MINCGGHLGRHLGLTFTQRPSETCELFINDQDCFVTFSTEFTEITILSVAKIIPRKTFIAT